MGYGSENRKFLAASFPGTPWILASATLDDEAICNIATSLGTSRSDQPFSKYILETQCLPGF